MKRQLVPIEDIGFSFQLVARKPAMFQPQAVKEQMFLIKRNKLKMIVHERTFPKKGPNT